MSIIRNIKHKLKRGFALTMKESWDLAEYIKVLEKPTNRCDSCIHSEERDGSNCYECVKGMADNFEAQPSEDCKSWQMIASVFKDLGLGNEENGADEYMEGLWDAYNAIKSLPPVTPQQTRWIPCSERLPEIHQNVLLSLRSLDIEIGFRAETEPYFYSHSADGYYIEPQNVLAWMPLPEPYKVESEDEE